MSSEDATKAQITQQVLDLYEKAWKLEKESLNLGIKKPKSEIFLSRETLQLLIDLQDDFNNDGSSLSPKLKQKKINLIEKYTSKLKTSTHIEMLTDFRNRNIILLLISIPCKQTINCINHLIKLKVNLDCIDNRGQNGYHIACQYSNYSVIKILYKYNVDITMKDESEEGLTPLHYALDILISNENNDNSINTYKYQKIAKLVCQYALLQGQDFVNDKLGNENGGNTWNFHQGQSIMDVAKENIVVLNVLNDGYDNCKLLRKEFKKQVLKYNKDLNETIVGLIWSFMYCKLPKLGLNSKLKKAKEKIARERMERRESLRKANKRKSSKNLKKINGNMRSTKKKKRKCKQQGSKSEISINK